MKINFTNRTCGANFSATENGVTVSGSYRYNEQSKKIVELSFNGNVGDRGFNGNVDADGGVSVWGVRAAEGAAVFSVLNDLMDGIQAEIAGE